MILPMLVLPVQAESIRWVDFNVSYESMKYALDQDIATFEQEKHISWIDILALAACRTGGKCGLASVKQAVSDLKKDASPEQLLGDLYKYYDYYHRASTAALGGLVGSYAIEKDGQWVATYGLKAFSPIAAGYGYSHCDDFGVARSFGFRRKHLGNDLMGALGTPVVAVEGGVVEAMGWSRYGGWRVGIRSFDSRRYYYYAHLQKDTPFAPGLAEGDRIVKIGKHGVHTSYDLSYIIMHSATEKTDITVIRGGETVVIPGVEFKTETESGVTVAMRDFRVKAERKSFGNVVKHSFWQSLTSVRMIWDSLIDLVTGKYGVDALSGPIGITGEIGNAVAAHDGGMNLMYLTAFIALSLGIFNLLPFPALDGGQIVLLIVELIIRKPVKREIAGYINFVGLALLMLLMLFVT